MIVVGLLFESVCLVVGMVVVLVEFGWWWWGWLGITGDGGIILLVMMLMVMGVLKWTPKAQSILVFL